MKLFYTFRVLHERDVHPAAKSKPVCQAVPDTVDFLPVAQVLRVISVVRPHHS